MWGWIAAAVATYLASRKNNQAAQQQQQQQQQFQEDMSGTAYQRAVADMKEAGLNPMLAYSQGGASTPSGAAPIQVPNAVGAGVSSALQGVQVMQGMQQLEVSNSQMDLNAAQRDKLQSETMARDLNTAKLIADTKATSASGSKTEEEILGSRYGSMRQQMEYRAMQATKEAPDLMGTGFEADVRRRKAEATGAELGLSEKASTSKFYEGVGQANPYLRQMLELLKGVSSARH